LDPSSMAYHLRGTHGKWLTSQVIVGG
jgi:hypothetical protein